MIVRVVCRKEAKRKPLAARVTECFLIDLAKLAGQLCALSLKARKRRKDTTSQTLSAISTPSVRKSRMSTDANKNAEPAVVDASGD